MDEKKFLQECLKELVAKGATDLHVKSGEYPRIRYRRKLVPLEIFKPTSPFLENLLAQLLTEQQKSAFELSRAVDFAFYSSGLGRFRVNAFYQKGEVAIVMRVVKDKVPNFEHLGLPAVLQKVSLEQRGMILVAGPVGSGKSTTIAAIIDYINSREERSIITIEDPIEYLHSDSKAFISQREIGLDTESFHQALRYVVRQDPDVIVIGEIRDKETFHAAISASETGRLVITTVHGKNVSQALDRILGFYPREQHPAIMGELSYNLKAIISQRLLPRSDGQGLVPTCEILLVNAAAGKVLRESRLDKLQQVMQNGAQEGMQTFNQSLLALFQKQLISREEALAASDNPHTLEMNMKGIFLDEASGGILGA
jgi:pilus retraction protein PilT